MKKYLLVLISLLLIDSAFAQSLTINEFLASNDIAAADEFGEYDDFIEIYNYGSEPADIGGMYITDDLTDPTLWQIPADASDVTTIPAGGFIVLWADKQTEQGPLHINLKLSAGGEQIGLYASDGVTEIDALTYEEQQTDVSYGQMPDGSGSWQIFPEQTDIGFTASPGKSNVTLKINEFLAKNDNVNHDEFGNYGDWIELFNYGVNDVDVTGMLLTDVLDNPDTYVFNPATVPAGGYLLIWADGSSEDPITDPDYLHANFKLGAGGEAVGLFLTENTVIDSYEFGPQSADISTGRFPDGTDNWITFSVPTPNEKNFIAEGATITDVEKTPMFPEYTDDVTVAATVVANASGLNVVLKYSAGGDYIDVQMNNVGDDNFIGVIPAQPKGTRVKWYLEASDDAPSVVTFPADAPESYLSYRVTDWTPSNAVDLTSIVREPSGLAYNANTSTLFTVSDGTDSDIFEISTDGELLNTLDVNGFDFEGIAFDANYENIFVVEETNWKVVKYSLDGTRLDEFEVAHQIGQANGLEGITIDHSNGNIFLLHEKNSPELIELSADGTQINRTTLDFVSDASGITLHPTWGTIFFVSDEGFTLNEMTKDGEFLRSWYIPINQAEGVTFGASPDVIYIVADRGNSLYQFPFDFDPYTPPQTLYVNEFMSSNDAAYYDPATDDYPDWIEIYNPTSDPINIGGYYITDGLDDLTLWQIPDTQPDSTTVPANGFLLLLADKKPEYGVLHVNLKLSGGGEQIGLTAPDGTSIIDSLTYGEQTTDISYGRYPDGGDAWAFFAESTPGTTNNNVVKVEDENISPDKFQLMQNYPNPFNPSTRISFTIPENDFVSLKIYNLLGQEISVLLNSEMQAGNYNINFDASALSSGIYIYTLTAGTLTASKKMVLLR